MGRVHSFCFIAILFIKNQAFTYLSGSNIRFKRNNELATRYGHEDRSSRTHSNQKIRPREYSTKSSSLNKKPTQGVFRERTKAFQEARRLLIDTRTLHEIADWMKHIVQQNVPFELDPKEGPEFIKELAKRNAFDTVLIFLRQLSDRSVFVYTSAISVLANSKTMRHEAMELLDEMNDNGVQPNTYTFTALFNSVDGAQASTKLLERIRKDYPQVMIRVEVYNAAIHACSRGDRQDWNTALNFFFQMKSHGIKPNQPTFASLLHTCARAGQLLVALSLLQEIKLTMVPNVKVWGAALNACAQAGNYKEATNILHDMQEMGISPTTWHLSALLTALARAGQLELALQMLGGMEDGNPIVFPVAGGNKKLILPPVPLDLVAINTVLFACAKVENSQAAKDLLEKLKSGYYTTWDSNNNKVPILPDEISYNAVLSACRDPSEAKAIVKEMRMSRRHRHGATPPSHITFTHAISTCRTPPQ